jgi:hypothetical protein
MLWPIPVAARSKVGIRLRHLEYWDRGFKSLGYFLSFLIFTQSVGLLGREISPSQDPYLHAGQHQHRINAHRHPCLKWNSNPISQCRSGWRRFMLQTARPLWSPLLTYLRTQNRHIFYLVLHIIVNNNYICTIIVLSHTACSSDHFPITFKFYVATTSAGNGLLKRADVRALYSTFDHRSALQQRMCN